MSSEVGVIRSGVGLASALDELGAIERETRSGALRGMAVAGMLVAAAALRRTESRGAQFRSDFPTLDPAQAQRSYMTLAQAREVAARARTKAA
jgi:L-aspartate oxidase